MEEVFVASNRRFLTLFVVFAAVATCFFLKTPTAHAAPPNICTFASIGDNNFNTAGNWDCGHVPGNGDTALIPASTSTLLSANVEVSQVHATGTINAAGFSFTATSTAVIYSGGTVTSTSGWLSFGGVLTVGSQGAASLGSGSGNITASSTFYLRNGSTLDVGSGTTTAVGEFVAGGASVIYGRSGVFEVKAGATFDTAYFYGQSGTFKITGGGYQYINVSSINIASYFRNVIVNKPADAVHFNSNTTTTGNFIATSGTVNFGNLAIVYVQGNLIEDTGAVIDFDFNGIAHNLLFLAGGLAQTVSSTPLYDVRIMSDFFVNLQSHTTIENTLSIITGILKAATYNLTVSSTASINGSASAVTSTSGNLYFLSSLAMDNSAKLGTISGNITVSGTTQIFSSSELDVGSGTSTFASAFLHTGTVNNRTGTVVFQGSTLMFSGKFYGQNGKTILSGGSNQSISFPTDNASYFSRLEVNKSANTATFSNNATTTGNFTLYNGTLSLGSTTFNVGGNFTQNGGTFDYGTSMVNLNGSSGVMQNVSSTAFYNLTSNNAWGDVTQLSNITVVNDFYVRSRIWYFGSKTMNVGGNFGAIFSGMIAAETGTVNLNGSGNQTITASAAPNILTFYNLSINKSGGTASLIEYATTTGSFTVTTGTFSIGNNIIFTATGTYSNAGLITVGAGGKIIHPAESVKITNSSGVEVASITTPGSFYVTVADGNRNLSGTTTESFTVPVTTDAAAGSDSQTITLTETGAATGIFRNSSALNVVSSVVTTPNNNQLEVIANGSGSTSYTDNQDSSDTGSDTVNLVYTAAAPTPSPGGGGGGGGGGLAPHGYAEPPSDVDPARLENLKKLGLAVHNLVKLPDDGNPNTQEDSAVYYLGGDGRRHAFPNEKVFFTWFCDFSLVKTIQLNALASIPLGKNVTYRPGTRMVKFTTDPKVYAVTAGGILRWITTEAVAIQLYGADWNQKIDDISDAFYVNYSFGSDLTADNAAAYKPSSAAAGVNYPSDSLAIAGYMVSMPGAGLVCVADSDQDGLTDFAEYSIYKTDPFKADTDGDTLSDFDELKVYKTDPFKADTDGDGYADGVEVANGYSPLGPGKCATATCAP